MLFAADPWFRGIDLGSGPDGDVFVLDWSDSGECHESTGVHPDLGPDLQGHLRRGPKRPGVGDLAKLSGARSGRQLHRHPNDWYARRPVAYSPTGRPGATGSKGPPNA